MKALIIEDEVIAAQALRQLIAEVAPEIEILSMLQTIDESVEWFQMHPMPDLVFMDIHLADGSSFAIFEAVDVNCPVIFTTAYDEYALKAFQVNSIDYLLKPINKNDLKRAIDKYKKLNTHPAENNEWVNRLLASLKQTGKPAKSYFLVPEKDKLIPLSVSDIAYIYIDAKTVKAIHFNSQVYHLDQTLDDLMLQLDNSRFFRANRQYIVSHRAIKDISLWFGSKISINLSLPTPERIIVSKTRVGEFKKWFAGDMIY